MKKLLKKIVLFMICAMMLFTAGACDTRNNPNNPNNPDDPNGDSTVTEKPVDTVSPDISGNDVKGIHEINVTEGTLDFVTNGTSEYKIVVPAVKNFAEITTAADELVNFIAQSTGVVLPVVNDDTFQYSASSKIISVGDTLALEASGIEVDKDYLTRSGYRIVTKDNSVFLIGGGDFGTLYSAYEFLHHMVGFETYAADEIAIERHESLKLKNFDVTDIPDFTYRMTNYGAQRNDNQAAQRMRMNQESATSGKVWMGPDNMPWHNTFAYLPKSKYGTNTKWYSVDGKQLCFLARGYEEEQKKMFDAFMAEFIKVVNANPEVDNITITQQDVNVWCTCEACTAEKEKYGTDSATIVKFCNKVSVALEEYFNENPQYKRNVNILFFAYHKTETAPVKINENGEFEPIDNSVICRDNVYCFYAPIFANYTYSFYDGENKTYADTMDAWCVLSKKLYLWIYSTNFGNYLAPYNSFNSMQDNYQFSKAHNASYMFDQGQWNQNASTGFGNLKAYLNAKLQWDVTLDFNALVDDFFVNYFKDASEPMLDMFNYYRTWMAYLENELKIEGVLGQTITTSQYFPQGTLNTILSFVDKAYEAIEPLKSTNISLYNTIYDRICLESIAYRKMQIDLYSHMYTDAQITEMKKSFKDDCVRIGVSKSRENADISDLWTSWGL